MSFYFIFHINDYNSVEPSNLLFNYFSYDNFEDFYSYLICNGIRFSYNLYDCNDHDIDSILELNHGRDDYIWPVNLYSKWCEV